MYDNFINTRDKKGRVYDLRPAHPTKKKTDSINVYYLKAIKINVTVGRPSLKRNQMIIFIFFEKLRVEVSRLRNHQLDMTGAIFGASEKT